MPINIDTPTWVSLALQIPLALVIVFLVIRFLDHMKTIHTSTLTFIMEQAQVNREFLSAQREQMNAAVTRLAEEIKSNKLDTVKEIATLTTQVDHTLERLLEFDNRLRDRERRYDPQPPTRD